MRLSAPIATKVVCFSLLLKCLRNLHGKQCGHRSDCSYRSSLYWVTLFASILNSSVMLGKYLQQTTSADDLFRCIFFFLANHLLVDSLHSVNETCIKNDSVSCMIARRTTDCFDDKLLFRRQMRLDFAGKWWATIFGLLKSTKEISTYPFPAKSSIRRRNSNLS